MSDRRYEILAGLPPDLPDWAILSNSETAAVTGLSEDTLDRLRAKGEGIERTQLSARRFGHAVGAVRRFLQKRSSA
jgi:hypothetical protein